MRNHKGSFLLILSVFATSALLASWAANTQAQKSRAAVANAPAVVQQPLYTDYKGVRLGMTTQDVRTRLGEPAVKDSKADYYVFSETEAAQIVYDAESKVKVISADYQNGTGAPPAAAVIGGEPETMPNGSLYKLVRYETMNFWVSYSRTTGAAGIVTITIQKIEA
jgi:outer membrane protein assembly factor BamE (lipoprotein component of BamABCDE complex)